MNFQNLTVNDLQSRLKTCRKGIRGLNWQIEQLEIKLKQLSDYRQQIRDEHREVSKELYLRTKPITKLGRGKKKPRKKITKPVAKDISSILTRDMAEELLRRLNIEKR